MLTIIQEIVDALETELQKMDPFPGQEIDLAERPDTLADEKLAEGSQKKENSLSVALEYRRLAILCCSGPKNHACYLGRLADTLVIKYRWTGSVKDLRNALKYDEDAIFMVTPHSSTTRIALLSSYAGHLYEAYEEALAVGFLNDTIRIAKQTISEDTNQVVDWAFLQDIIAKALTYRYLRQNNHRTSTKRTRLQMLL